MGEAISSDRRLVCTYRGPQMVLGMVVFLILGSGAGYVAVQVASGAMINKDTGKPTAPEFGYLIGLASAALLFLALWAVLCLVNERIVLDGETILWRDKFGRERVRCTAHDVLPLSFSETQRYSSDHRASTTVYRLGTRMGTIKFDSNISNSDALADRFKSIANGQTEQAGSGASHWTTDPLSESDSG